ncbi:MAG: MFS transporter [Nitriliruptor sp.]|nr:MAG: MFS transporter [Nitriliruptor sp.]
MATDRVLEFLFDTDDSLLEELPPSVADEVPGNAARQVAAMALQKAGDLIVDAKTVLPWLLASVGAPAALTGLLVPIRESGSMLPQASLAPMVRRRAIRKWLWVMGAGGQAVAVGVMTGFALLADGSVAGWGILAALAVFALARSLSSLASKDVLGRTIPKGARGRVTGTATVASGAVAITVGLGLRLFGGEDAGTSTLAILLGCAALAWVAAGAIYARIEEAPGEQDDGERSRPLADAWELLRDDAPFRRFVLARTLLLVSALSPPFIVTLATQQGNAGLQGLGPFVISSGVAALVGGRLWGRFADRSSRLTMSLAAGAASIVVLIYLALLQMDGVGEFALLHPATYLLLALSHTGVRVGRKTFIVDLAEGNQRTNYVAVSNSAMGVLLLVVGAVSSAIALLGPAAALLFLAVLGLVGVVVARSLPEVSAGA